MKDILNQLQNWYEEAKNSYEVWDSFLRCSHDSEIHEGGIIRRAKAEGAMQGYYRVIKMLQEKVGD